MADRGTPPATPSGALASDLLRLAALLEEVAQRHAINRDYLEAAIAAATRGFMKHGQLDAAALAGVAVRIYDVIVAARPARDQIEHTANLAAWVYFGGDK